MARTPGARSVTAEQRTAIVERARSGEKYRIIADALQLDRSTVAKHARDVLGYRCAPRAKQGLAASADFG